MIDQSIFTFWSQEGNKNIQPGNTPTLHEGWDARLFLRELFSEDEYGTVIDVGCGYGRLSEAFNPENYLGLDFCQKNIAKATKEYPAYTFKYIDNINYPISNTKILFYVLLHQTDEDIESIVKILCDSSKRIVVAEVCGREWRRKGNPPVFNRNVEEYIKLFADNGKDSLTIINKSYIPYANKYTNRNTDVNILVFE